MTALTADQVADDRKRMHDVMSNKAFDELPMYELAKLAKVPRERFSVYAAEFWPERVFGKYQRRPMTDTFVVKPELRQRIEEALADPANHSKTIVELRGELHCTRMAIRKVARELGVRLREGKFKLGNTKHTQDKTAEIRRLHGEGKNVAQIAQAMKMSPETIAEYASQTGIKLSLERTRGSVKVDHVEALRQTVMEVSGIAAGLRMVPIDFSNINKATAQEYGDMLRPALRDISSLMRKLREKASVTES